jgi:hypothetical protein
MNEVMVVREVRSDLVTEVAGPLCNQASVGCVLFDLRDCFSHGDLETEIYPQEQHWLPGYMVCPLMRKVCTAPSRNNSSPKSATDAYER